MSTAQEPDAPASRRGYEPAERLFWLAVASIAALFAGLFFTTVLPPILQSSDFVRGALLDGFVNPTARGYTLDTILTGCLVLAWIAYERAVKGVRNGWIAAILVFVPGVVVGLAAYLWLRSRPRGAANLKGTSSLVLAVLLLVASSAQAEDAEDVPRPLELDLGVYLHPGFGQICHRAASDVVDCTYEWSAGGLGAARWRFSEHASLGGFVGLLWSGGSDYDSMHTRLAAQLRVLPFGSRMLGLWLGPDAGINHVTDSVHANELGGARSFGTVAPAFGLATGIGVPLTEWLQVSIMLRGYIDVWGTLDYRFGRKPERETQAGVGLGLSLTLLP